ncbi:DUF6443 domain-containing protein [Dyadobacter bucti]|uniref:DUF6443 domain-containing protein n=1 Tax=Dyadobacter bucti TaxID=2572203 RepID=UPI003F703F3D
MKHFISLIYLCVFTLPLHAQQTNSRNYIIKRTYKQAGANADDVSKAVTQVQYFDGLGRPIQTVTVGQSPSGHDFVEPVEYDAAGRVVKKYLPYVVSGNGAYQSNSFADAQAWYTANTADLQPADLGRPYLENVYEPAPTSRISGQRAQGNKSAASVVKYKVNSANQVNRYDYDPTANTIVQVGQYAAGTLTYTNTTDEQGNVTNEFVDMLGQTICRQVLTASGTLSTYYVFDDLGLLRAVLQPNYQDLASLTDNAFTYDYDDRGRMTVKRIPGGGVTELVYDQYDRLALSRDPNQLARGVWAFTKYDALDRPVASGEIASALTRVNWSVVVDANTQHHEERSNGVTAGYTLDKTAPKNATEANLLTITFYDDYAFSKGPYFAFDNLLIPSFNPNVRGQVTGSRIRMLPGSGGVGGFLTNVVYYDQEYRPIQTAKDLHDLGPGVYERHSKIYKYDLAPVLEFEEVIQWHTPPSGYLYGRHFEYDHADRLLSLAEEVGTPLGPISDFTASYRYNALGNLQNKWLCHVKDDKYRVRSDYNYNIRGWLTEGKSVYKKTVVDPDMSFFGFELSYASGGTYTNGNVSQMQWKNKNEVSYTKGLNFSYDGANRLIGSAGLSGYTDVENGITYDKNGNIKTLTRAGSVADNLTYSYTGNKLTSITDISGSNLGIKTGVSNYSYDANGNMLTDGNRGATISYNYLNLPKIVAVNTKTQTYDYDATGIKHKYVADTVTIKYEGVFEYRTVGAVNSLSRIALTEGQAILNGDVPKFDYYLKDHLNNVRVVFNDLGKIVQRTDYYPFGLEIDRNNPVQTPGARNGVNRYLFNGIEKQPETGIYQARFRGIDPALGRWMQIDPKPDQSMSPYTAMNNNPIRFTDPLGDTAIVNNRGVILKQYGGDNVIYQQGRKGKLTQIGEFGKSVNLNGILPNIMKDNKRAAKMMGALGFANAVRPGGKWDYKNAEAQKRNIFGAIARFDDKTKAVTSFIFGNLKFHEGGADVGNFNYGYTGRYVGNNGYSPVTLWAAAGLLQIGKDLLKREFYKATEEFGSIAPRMYTPFGDENDDFIWTTTGMIRADNEQKNNN